jgi:hypothetical protein
LLPLRDRRLDIRQITTLDQVQQMPHNASPQITDSPDLVRRTACRTATHESPVTLAPL